MAENKIVFDVTVNADGAVNASKNFKAQLREANKEAQETAIIFGATSKAAIDAAKKVALMKEEIADVKDTIDALHPEAKLNAVTGAVQGIAGGFAAAEGAMALFGTQSEEVQKQLMKVQGALALSQGINSVLSMGDAFKNLKIVVAQSAIAQGLYNVVVGASTGLMKILRIAIASTGVGALIVGIGLLVANFEKVKTTMLEMFPVFEKLASLIRIVGNAIGLMASEEELAAEKSLAVAKKSRNEKATLMQEEIAMMKANGNDKNKILEAELNQAKYLVEKSEAELKELKSDATDEEKETARKNAFDARLAYAEARTAIREEAESQDAKDKEARDKANEKRKKEAEEKKAKTIKEEQEATQALIKAEEERQAVMRKYTLDVTARREELDREERLKTFEGRKQQIRIDLENELELLTSSDASTQALKQQLKINANNAELAIDAEFAKQQEAIDKQRTDKEKEEAEKRKTAREAYGSSMLSGFKTLGANLEANNKKATAVAKAAAIADLGVQTGKGIANAVQIGTNFGASLGPAGVVATPIAIGSMIALTLANFAFAAKKIGAPTTNGAPSAGGSPTATAPTTTVTSTQAQTDTGALRAQANQPIRAVVVETDLTSTQRRVNSIEERATF